MSSRQNVKQTKRHTPKIMMFARIEFEYPILKMGMTLLQIKFYSISAQIESNRQSRSKLRLIFKAKQLFNPISESTKLTNTLDYAK